MEARSPVEEAPPAADLLHAASHPRDLDGRLPAFESCLSLAPLVSWWREVAEGKRRGNRHAARLIVRAVERSPRLLEPYDDPKELEGHRDLVTDLLSAVFPEALGDAHCAVALVPSRFRMLHCTPAFRRLLLDEQGRPCTNDVRDMARLNDFELLNAYLTILRRFYDLDCDFEQSFVASSRCPERGLEIHFQFQVNLDFVTVRVPHGLPPLDDAQRARIRQDATNLALLQELLPLERFRLEGIVVMEAIDVTTQQAISGIKQELIDHASLLAGDHLTMVQQKLRTLLRLPELTMRVGAIQGEEVFLFAPPGPSCVQGPATAPVAHDSETDRSRVPPGLSGNLALAAMLDRTACLSVRDFGRICRQTGQPDLGSFIPADVVLVEDMDQVSYSCPRHACLRSSGFRSCLLAPLEVDGQTVGVLELASPGVGDLNPTKLLRLREALPLFALAVRRTIDHMNVRVQAVIKEQFTSIHPAVEWRFRRSALAFIRSGGEGALEPLVFPNVHALFGVSDIRSSSTLRNQAIQSDLLEQLGLAHDALSAAHEARSLPYLGQLAYRVDRRMVRIAPGLASGDESSIVEFLKHEVEPVLDRIQGFGEGVRERVGCYRAALDEHLGILYRRRRDFEDSVSEIADVIGAYLVEEQERVQAVFPHYYEMHKTDGVDHSIYIGASLVEDPSTYDELYVRNLRLWQLMVMCVVARKVEELRSSLRLSLEVAHLVLVQHQPLSIRFHAEEKQFNVDGAYNVRYEIVKKRLDKAEIRGTGERLTQPRQIAVVYSQPREAEEYRRYLEYLAHRGYIEGPIESHDLGELQGVQGLKALRVSARMVAPLSNDETMEMAAPVAVLQGDGRGRRGDSQEPGACPPRG